MPLDAACPKCKSAFPVIEARSAVTVSCPSCDADMTVEFRKPASAPEAGQPHYEVLVRPGLAAAVATAAPPANKHRDDDEDEDSSRQGGSVLAVVLSLVFGLLFTLGGLGLTGWLLFVKLAPDDSSAANASTKPTTQPAPNPGGNKGTPTPNPGGNKGTPNPNPGGKKDPPVVPPPPPPKPKDEFTLRPVPGLLSSITPPEKIEEGKPKTILLPSKVGAVAIGGGGRYIVFHFAQQNRLTVFDANIGDFNQTQSIESGEVHLAAGANKLAVCSSRTNKIRIYSLPDLKQEQEIETRLNHYVHSMAMGAATNGPLLVANPFGDVVLVDLATGKPIEGSAQGLSIPTTQLRATLDGKLFLCGNGYSTRDKFTMLDESGKKWQIRQPELLAAYPGADGKFIYGKNQIINSEGTVVVEKPEGVENVWYVPAATATGNYFMMVHEIKGPKQTKTNTAVSLTIHKDNDITKTVVPALEKLVEMERLVQPFVNSTQPLDRHLFLIPEAKLLVILNNEKTRLVVRKLPL